MSDKAMSGEPPDPPRRRASDYAQPFSMAVWIRTNLGMALAIMGGASALFGGIVAVTLWYASVNGIASKLTTVEPRVDKIRGELDDAERAIKLLQENIVNVDKRLNDQRAYMDASQRTADEVRRALDKADSDAREYEARLDERIKGLEVHSSPLPLSPAPHR